MPVYAAETGLVGYDVVQITTTTTQTYDDNRETIGTLAATAAFCGTTGTVLAWIAPCLSAVPPPGAWTLGCYALRWGFLAVSVVSAASAVAVSQASPVLVSTIISTNQSTIGFIPAERFRIAPAPRP